MADEATSKQGAAVKPYKIVYNRSQTHRYVPADGCWLGLNGLGKIILNFFSDSPPLPTHILGETTADGKTFTSKEPETIYEDAGSVRSFEISVTMTLMSAKVLQETLGNFIKLGEAQEGGKEQSAHLK